MIWNDNKIWYEVNGSHPPIPHNKENKNKTKYYCYDLHNKILLYCLPILNDISMINHKLFFYNDCYYLQGLNLTVAL